MSDETIPVTVLILDKEYRVACAQDEHAPLLESARFLDEEMREIRNSGKVIGTDRIAVMAALNLAHELLSHKTDNQSGAQAINNRLHAIQRKIEIALNEGNQLEL